jgi:hypothetical protein
MNVFWLSFAESYHYKISGILRWACRQIYCAAPAQPSRQRLLTLQYRVLLNDNQHNPRPSRRPGTFKFQLPIEEFQVTGKNRSTAIPVFSWPFPTADEAIAVLPRMACRVQG